jgi:DNA-binding ferritin-like protein (Dps family)
MGASSPRGPITVITVRNLPPKLAKAIREKARKERLSLNRTVIKLLEEATGATKDIRKVVNHDLDRFFGTWTKEEADAFDQALREQRQVEPEMWE